MLTGRMKGRSLKPLRCLKKPGTKKKSALYGKEILIHRDTKGKKGTSGGGPRSQGKNKRGGKKPRKGIFAGGRRQRGGHLRWGKKKRGIQGRPKKDYRTDVTKPSGSCMSGGTEKRPIHAAEGFFEEGRQPPEKEEPFKY